MLVLGNAESFGSVGFLAIDFAVNGESSVTRIVGKHLCGASGGGEEHTFHIVVGERLDYCSCHRRFAGTGVTAKQKHRVGRRSEAKIAELSDERHLVGIGVVGQIAHDLNAEVANGVVERRFGV